MWQNFQEWLSRPFTNDMSALQWFYFIGLLLVILVLWRIILRHIFETIE